MITKHTQRALIRYRKSYITKPNRVLGEIQNIVITKVYIIKIDEKLSGTPEHLYEAILPLMIIYLLNLRFKGPLF